MLLSLSAYVAVELIIEMLMLLMVGSEEALTRGLEAVDTTRSKTTMKTIRKDIFATVNCAKETLDGYQGADLHCLVFHSLHDISPAGWFCFPFRYLSVLYGIPNMSHMLTLLIGSVCLSWIFRFLSLL